VSEANVALVENWFQALAGSGELDLESFDPAIEVHNFDTFPITKPYFGREGFVQWFLDMSEPFEDFRFELVRIVGSTDESVAFECRAAGKSHTGGPDFDLVWGGVVWVRDGQAFRIEGFRTADEALAATGR
jgi:ketosteroid isomerase-like protein